MPAEVYSRRTFEERFWSKVDKTDGCWEWTGTLHKPWNYGRIRYHGVDYYAHRVSWEIANGNITDGLLVCHRCDNPPCVRPDHLFLGTSKDNQQDMAAKGRHFSVTHPDWVARGERHGSQTKPERVSHGETHHKAKLTELQVRDIRRRAAEGVSVRGMAREYGLAVRSMQRVVWRQTWKHIQ